MAIEVPCKNLGRDASTSALIPIYYCMFFLFYFQMVSAICEISRNVEHYSIIVGFPVLRL